MYLYLQHGSNRRARGLQKADSLIGLIKKINANFVISVKKTFLANQKLTLKKYFLGKKINVLENNVHVTKI